MYYHCFRGNSKLQIISHLDLKLKAEQDLLHEYFMCPNNWDVAHGSAGLEPTTLCGEQLVIHLHMLPSASTPGWDLPSLPGRKDTKALCFQRKTVCC